MLDNSDEHFVQGNKFIERIYVLQKFQSYKGQSLHIFDNQSQVLDEEGAFNEDEADEGGRQIHTGTSFNPHLQKGLIRDINIEQIFALIQDNA